MDMEELNKSQLILLALLVSFVTSIATGIVTVTLMDQAPPGVTKTINNIVERTVEIVQPEKETQIITQETVIRESDLIKDAVQKNIAVLVILYTQEDEAKREVGSGFLVTSDGFFATDIDSALLSVEEKVFAEYGGRSFKTRLVSYDEDIYAAIMQLDELVQEDEEEVNEAFFTPVVLSQSSPVLGDAVIVINATGGVEIASGIVTHIEKEKVELEDGSVSNNNIKFIYTDIIMAGSVDGGPLVFLNGEVGGLVFVSKNDDLLAIPAQTIQNMINVVIQQGVETAAQNAQSAAVLSGVEGIIESEESVETETEVPTLQ